MSWKGESEPNIKFCMERKLGWLKDSPQYRTLDNKVHEFMTKMGEPEQFQGRIIFMSMFNDIIWGYKDNERECNANPTLVFIFAKRFPAGRWSFLRPGSEKKWISTYIDRPQGEWDRVAESMMIRFGESGHPVFRVMSPLSRGKLKSKGGGKLSIHFCADDETIKTVFRTIISVNRLSINGAVSDLCDEYRICQARTGRLVLAEQSDPLPSTDDPAQEDYCKSTKNERKGSHNKTE